MTTESNPIALAFAALVLCFAQPGIAATNGYERTYRVALELAPDGSVVQARAWDDVPDVLRPTLESLVDTWAYAPGEVEGQPQPTRTTLSVRMAVGASPDDGSALQVRPTGASVGVAALDSPPPRYPARAARRGQSGVVWVEIDVRGDGSVEDARVHPRSPAAPGVLQTAAVDSAQQWRFVTEQVGGRGLAASVVVPVCFTLHDAPPGPDSLPSCRVELDEGSAPSDGVLTLDPAARLLPRD
ncbi:MAG: energy transducer TonB [Lysobacteraceae bacterium]